MSWWNRKRRFSLERLKELLSTLQKNPVVTPRNRSVIVETLRELAELLVWGDQNDEKLFDWFLEKNVWSMLLRIMEQKDVVVQIQLLQTLSILLENISTSGSLYYLLSQERVNTVILYQFDFSDEELMAYYISFLKTLSLKLDSSTVQFFFNSESLEFPLYTESIKFFNHQEGMVRTGVRTITLAVFKVADPKVRSFIVSGKSAPYFSNLVWFIQSKSEELESLVKVVPTSPQAMHRFRDCVDELSDLLYYIQDIYQLNISELSVAMSSNLLDKLALFVAALNDDPLIPLYVLGQLFVVLKEPQLIHALSALLLASSSSSFGPPRLFSLLSDAKFSLPASFLLLAIAKSSAAPSLLGAALTRQSSLLQAILSDASSSETPPPPAASSLADASVVAALEQLLALPSAPVLSLQCAVLLLRALQAKKLSTAPYRACASILAGQLASSPVATLAMFESGIKSYKQVNFSKLANEPTMLLLLKKDPDDLVHRFLTLRDLFIGQQRETILPLTPNLQLLSAGSLTTIPSTHVWMYGRLVLAVHETHVEILETSLDEDKSGLPPTAKVLASIPVQHVDLQFVHESSCSHSIPSTVLRLSAPPDLPNHQDMQFATPELAVQAQQQIVKFRDAVVDSKIKQLERLFSEQ